MLTQADEDMESGPDRQEVTIACVMVKKKNLSLILATRQSVVRVQK